MIGYALKTSGSLPQLRNQRLPAALALRAGSAQRGAQGPEPRGPERRIWRRVRGTAEVVSMHATVGRAAAAARRAQPAPAAVVAGQQRWRKSSAVAEVMAVVAVAAAVAVAAVAAAAAAAEVGQVSAGRLAGFPFEVRKRSVWLPAGQCGRRAGATTFLCSNAGAGARLRPGSSARSRTSDGLQFAGTASMRLLRRVLARDPDCRCGELCGPLHAFLGRSRSFAPMPASQLRRVRMLRVFH